MEFKLAGHQSHHTLSFGLWATWMKPWTVSVTVIWCKMTACCLGKNCGLHHTQLSRCTGEQGHAWHTALQSTVLRSSSFQGKGGPGSEPIDLGPLCPAPHTCPRAVAIHLTGALCLHPKDSQGGSGSARTMKLEGQDPALPQDLPSME